MQGIYVKFNVHTRRFILLIFPLFLIMIHYLLLCIYSLFIMLKYNSLILL